MPELGIIRQQKQTSPVRICVASDEDGSARNAEVLVQYGASTIASVHEPARRFRLPGLRLARSETHPLLRVLRERRQGGRLKLPGDRTVGIDEKPKPEFRTDQLDSGTLKPPNPTPVGAADTSAIDHSHKG
jgi:hypothetical protein